MSGPLSHVRVLDLSRIMAGPWASQILADLGADVIKVERPGVGDDTRSWGPPFLQDSAGKPTPDSGYFLCVNRGKRSITLDMSVAADVDIIRKLARRSDILLENFKVDTLAKFGLAYADLKLENPGLIYASVTGFGQNGPRRAQAAYDFMIQAMGGLMSITGGADDQPGGGPQKVGVPVVDLMTGMYTAVAVLAALARRERTGEGDYIDIAMLDVQAAFLANQAMNYLLTDKLPIRRGNRHPNIQPQDVCKCRDGYIAIAVGNDEQFKKFCKVLALTQLAEDERFATNANRVRNLPALMEFITSALMTDDVANWASKLDAAGVPCAPINSVADALADPQVQARNMVRELTHPVAGTVPQVISPMNFQNAPLQFERAPPMLGQHSREILKELGLSDEEISARR